MSNSVLSLTNHELFLVSCCEAGNDNAMIASWLLPATLAPSQPRLLLAASVSNLTTEMLRRRGSFAVQMLDSEQLGLLVRFGLYSGRDRNKWIADDGSDLRALRTPAGHALLAGGCGWADCTTAFELDLGDRLIVVADIGAQDIVLDREPLRKKDALTRLPPDQAVSLAKKALDDGERDAKLMRQAQGM
ncbi:MAG: flavin reductase [Deltaproteobacteria bacterium]|nr:flavin reductase [Deltaproteobacteria bacterium]